MGNGMYMLLGGAIAIVGIAVMILLCMLAAWISDYRVRVKINKAHKNYMTEKELRQCKEKLGEARDLIKNLLKVTYGDGWIYNYEWKVKADKFLGEIEE